ncbi:MAG: response regulator [Phormidesmis sp. RL_2_1]|nr:response regulator [Phormidesmis sp. RL_2_1]
MLPEQQQRIMGYFIEEAKDHLNTIEQGLLSLQATIEDAEKANEIFRAAHSVKGGAAMLGLESIQKTAHRMEDYFKVLKESPVQVDRALETMFLRVSDGLKDLLEELEGPFGLTQDKAQAIMNEVEPVFERLEEHLNALVSKGGRSSIAAKTYNSDSSDALQMSFKQDVPLLLRQMLAAFKQPDSADTRKVLQSTCIQLKAIGEQFNLPDWCDLIETARIAAVNPNNDYRTLAPILIKEVKKGQDLVLVGRASEVAVCEALQALMPEDILATELAENAERQGTDLTALGEVDYPEVPDGLEDLSLVENSASLSTPYSAEVSAAEIDDLFDSAPAANNDDFDRLFEDALFEISPEDSQDVGQNINSASVSAANNRSEAVGEDEIGRLSMVEFDEIPLELSTLNRHQDSDERADESLDALLATVNVTGPDVGTDELNSLADLFDGDLDELDNTLGGHAFISEEMRLNPEKIDLAASDDLTDLLAGEAAGDTEPDEEVVSATEIEDDLFGGTLTEGAFATDDDLSDEEANLSFEDEFSAVPSLNTELSEIGISVDAADDAAELAEDLWEDQHNPGLAELGLEPNRALDIASLDIQAVSEDADLSDVELNEISEEKPLKKGPHSPHPSVSLLGHTPASPREEEIEFPTLTGAKLQKAEEDIDSFFLGSSIEEATEQSGGQIADDPWGELSLYDTLTGHKSADNQVEDSEDISTESAAEKIGAEANTIEDVCVEDAAEADFLDADNDLSFSVDLDIEQAGSELENLLSQDLDEINTNRVAVSEANLVDDDLWDNLLTPSGPEESEPEESELEELGLEQSPSVDTASIGFLKEEFPKEEFPKEEPKSEEEEEEEEKEEADLDSLQVSAHGLFADEPLGQDNPLALLPNQPLEEDSAEAEVSELVLDGFFEESDLFHSVAEDLSMPDEVPDEVPEEVPEEKPVEANREENYQGENHLEVDDLLNLERLEEEVNQADGKKSAVEDDSFLDLDGLLAEDFSDDIDDIFAPENPLADEQSNGTEDDRHHGVDDELGDDFDDLESLLFEAEEPAESLDSEDFSAVDKSNGNSADNDAVPESATLAASGGDREDEDFEDLERLLEDGATEGPVTVVARRTAPQRSSRRGSGVREQNMRVSVSHLDTLSNLVGELVVSRNTLERDQERLRQFLDNLLFQVQQLNDVGQRMRDLYERSLLESSLMSNRRAHAQGHRQDGGAAAVNHVTGETFDALEMDKFTGFHTLSQEMIELIVRVRESSSDIGYTVESSDQVTRQFRQITTQLQEGLNTARMVAFSQAADRLPRAVRDISLKCGKEARLIVEGQNTLIDKMIVEHLYDPLTHLVNNAITHGIETPEQRQASGKLPEGSITVRAFYQGNQTVIYVADDGGGINTQFVKQKAVEKQLINPAEADSLSDLETYELLFHPGFSTRDQADDFAGRGVGMDVVRTSLAEIRGSITIDSELGKGTSFTIRLPLTLSISKALSCVSNQARIAFPMDGVEDMLDVPRDRILKNDQGQDCVRWRDNLLPFQPVTELLKFNRTIGRGRVYGGSQDDDVLSVIVLRSANTFIAVQVDQVIGEQEIVIKQLEGPVPKPLGIAGATVLGDGRVMPIADVLELIDIAMGRIRREPTSILWAEAAAAVEETPVKSDPTVLIVDDSITVRELLSMSFNKVGYRVEQARDGQEAWDKLRSGLPCDLVFCDIEMPRMDGLELLSRMQKDNHLNRIPIAMLTSRGADRHRQMAVDLGASGYFTKPYLEEALLDAAQRMLNGETLAKGRGG